MGNIGQCKRSMRLSKCWGENPKSVWWNYDIKDAVKRKEAPWKRMLAASGEDVWKCTERRRERLEGV